MLTEERFAAILSMLEEKRAVTVTELTRRLDASESTVRRDLNALHEMGKLVKVHGGATAREQDFFAQEEDVVTKAALNVEEKERIARYAAATIQDDDFVYIDAGTTTERMIDFIPKTRAAFVTNGIVHAKKLVQKGLKAYVVGGQLKLATEAVIGAEAVNSLKKYHFTKCFLGVNGISPDCGCTTPEVEEAMVKAEAVSRSFLSYILADHTKFGKVYAVTFAEIGQCCILTDRLPEDKRYTDATVVKEVTA